MVTGLMKKLSEFKGQEHITSVLRAMVIKDDVRPLIAFDGSYGVARQLALAFLRSLNCKHPAKGDACNDCAGCLSYPSNNILAAGYTSNNVWWGFHVEEAPAVRYPKAVYFKFAYDAEFLNFTIKEAAGAYLNKDLIRLAIFAMCGEIGELLTLSKTLSVTMTSQQFLTDLLEVFKSLVYLQNNLELKETENLDLLRRAAPGFHPYLINAAMRLLWDSQDKIALPDELAIQSVSVLLAELLHPTPKPSYTNITSGESEKPIIVVEESTGQTLDIAEMLRIAHE